MIVCQSEWNVSQLGSVSYHCERQYISPQSVMTVIPGLFRILTVIPDLFRILTIIPDLFCIMTVDSQSGSFWNNFIQ